MDYEKLKSTLSKKGISVSQLCLKVGIDRQTWYNNISEKSMRIDILEKICEVLKVDIVEFFPQTKTRQKSEFKLELETGDKLYLDIDSKVLQIKKD